MCEPTPVEGVYLRIYCNSMQVTFARYADPNCKDELSTVTQPFNQNAPFELMLSQTDYETVCVRFDGPVMEWGTSSATAAKTAIFVAAASVASFMI